MGKKKDKNNNEFLKDNDDVECSPLMDDVSVTLQENEFKVADLNVDASMKEIIYVKNETLNLYATTKILLETILSRIGINIDNPNYIKSVKELIQTQFDILKEYNTNLNLKTLLELNLDKNKEGGNSPTTKNMVDFINEQRKLQQNKKDLSEK